MGVNLLRTKALALILGPAGIGLAALYTSTVALIGSIAGLGLNASGVRQIAEASGSKDDARVAKTIITLQRLACLCGILGMLLVLALAPVLSRATFGDSRHVFGISLMSLTLLFASISAGQNAVLQGLRRLRDLAVSQVLGTLLGAIVSISLVWWFHEAGIVPYLILIAFFSILLSWWYARRVKIQPSRVTWSESAKYARGLIGMGLAFTTSGLSATATNYVTQILIQHELGRAAVGIYSATWTLSSYYVGFVLTAMGTDFMPRLTAAAHDHATMNRLVNEQAETGVLIAIPGVLGTLVLAPWVMKVFFSSDFVSGTELVRWQIIGVFLRVVSWPLGYVLIAEGRSVLYTVSEIVYAAINVLLVILCMRLWSLEGLGIAFALLYLCVTLIVFLICRRLTGFQWSATAVNITVPAILVLAFVFCCTRFLPEAWAITIGLISTVVVSLASFLGLQKLLNVNLWKVLSRKLRPQIQ